MTQEQKQVNLQQDEIIKLSIQEQDDTTPIIKKRGRKPKGGKIIQNVSPMLQVKDNKPNVIIHLKCFMKDLHNQHIFTSNVEPFNSQQNYNVLNNDPTPTPAYNNFEEEDVSNNCYENNMSNNDMKELWKKIKQLEHNLHINNIHDKKSACFWCTHNFDNPPIYIPKYYIKNSYHVYGCFCSPECATAFLMEENIDSSAKFERYYLLNHIYSKIFNYTKNIKPAPNPYYMLNKFYGNLSIQEYRALLKNERFFLVVDKPLTRILPELHEDNDDFMINNKIIPSNSNNNFQQQAKKPIQRKHNNSKNVSLIENFGIGGNISTN